MRKSASESILAKRKHCRSNFSSKLWCWSHIHLTVMMLGITFSQQYDFGIKPGSSDSGYHLFVINTNIWNKKSACGHQFKLLKPKVAPTKTSLFRKSCLPPRRNNFEDLNSGFYITFYGDFEFLWKFVWGEALIALLASPSDKSRNQTLHKMTWLFFLLRLAEDKQAVIF